MKMQSKVQEHTNIVPKMSYQNSIETKTQT
jgi:hypothetical protein